MTLSQLSCDSPAVEDKACDRCGTVYQIKTLAMPFGNQSVRVGSCPTCAADLLALKAKREEAERAQARERRVRQMLDASGIPMRYDGLTLADFRADLPAQAKIHKACTAYVENFIEAKGKGPSIVMCGRPGTGKTHMACAIMHEVMTRYLVPAGFSTVLGAIRTIKDTYRKDAEETETQAIERLTDIPLLVLDEIGVQVGSEHEKMLVFEIINERYQQCRSTILISNLPAPALSEYLGDRIMDRFRECGGILAFDWQSHRGTK